MLQQLLNHSPDIQKLWDDGLEIEYKNAHLYVHHIPYVNNQCQIKFGTLVTTLSLAGNSTTPPDNHVIYFIGEYPCNRDGQPIKQIEHSQGQNIGNGVTVNFSFSNKPPNGYPDYYEKVTRYIEIISAPAKSLDDSVTEKTYIVVESENDDDIFNYPDTNSARAQINPITEKLKGQKIAIVGLGGTGAYLLDLVAKTPVYEINLFDGDTMLQHNAFRAPGAPSAEMLRERKKKTSYLAKIYSNMHRKIFSHEIYIEAENVSVLEKMDFVFLCLDSGQAKKVIIDYLISLEVPFIDVGMGITKHDEKLMGIVRTTTSTKQKSDHIYQRISFTEDPNNEYTKNIQIADLNSLNAAFAVIKWKKLSGFYTDIENEHNSSFTLNCNQLSSEDIES